MNWLNECNEEYIIISNIFKKYDPAGHRGIIPLNLMYKCQSIDTMLRCLYKDSTHSVLCELCIIFDYWFGPKKYDKDMLELAAEKIFNYYDELRRKNEGG